MLYFFRIQKKFFSKFFLEIKYKDKLKIILKYIEHESLYIIH